jgi:hypothetical protein
MEWFLVILMYTSSGEYVDKTAIPMTGSMRQSCTRESDGKFYFNKKIEGTDYHKVLAVCVSKNEWRGY